MFFQTCKMAKESQWICINCKKEFKSARSRRRHEDHFCHTINVPAVNKDKHVMKRYKCNYCSKIFSNEEIESDIKITSVKINKKQLFLQCQKKTLKRCDEAESRSGGSVNSKLRKISDQFILSTDQSLAKHLNNNTNFYSRMILVMSLKVSMNGFWPIAFVNKNSTLYTKLSPYCAISHGNEVLNSIISDSFESDNNGKFVDIL